MEEIALSPFGAVICGVRIGDLSTSAAARVAAVIGRRRVAVFRDQRVDDADLTHFLAAFGELMFTEGETPVDGAPHLNIVSNIGRTTPPRSVFHTDTSYVDNPPAFTALRAVILPDSGGATLFSDQVAAAAALPKRVSAWLATRTLLHGTTDPLGRRRERRHPVLRRHPVTDETALFLSTPERCTALSDVDGAASSRIVRILYRRSIRASNVYAHHWRKGDVVIWDNRVTMHRADHRGVTGDRVLHRGLVQGEVPLAA